MVQWLRDHASMAGGTGSIPGRGTAMRCAQKIEEKKQIKWPHSAVTDMVLGGERLCLHEISKGMNIV